MLPVVHQIGFLLSENECSDGRNIESPLIEQLQSGKFRPVSLRRSHIRSDIGFVRALVRVSFSRDWANGAQV